MSNKFEDFQVGCVVKLSEEGEETLSGSKPGLFPINGVLCVVVKIYTEQELLDKDWEPIFNIKVAWVGGTALLNCEELTLVHPTAEFKKEDIGELL